MKFVPSKHDDYRVSVVVSKKIAKSAPDRNRIRRRVYEAIRLQIDEYKIKQDIVVTVFNDKFLSASHDELTKAIKSQLAEIAQQA
jgi:ribonuclease P protein component